MNTAGSILLATNEGNFRYMAGIYYPGNENKPEIVDSIKRSLWDYWGIQGHESAMDAMTRLVHSGMRVWYGEEMAKLEIIYHGYSKEELIEAAKLENPKADEDSFLPKMMMAYRRYGENALLGPLALSATASTTDEPSARLKSSRSYAIEYLLEYFKEANSKLEFSSST